MAAFGILNREECHKRFGFRPDEGDPEFLLEVPWLLAMGLYQLYYMPVLKLDDRHMQCEYMWTRQGNNLDGNKEFPQAYSLSMGDIAVFSDHSVWVAVRVGWQEIKVVVEDEG